METSKKNALMRQMAIDMEPVVKKELMRLTASALSEMAERWRIAENEHAVAMMQIADALRQMAEKGPRQPTLLSMNLVKRRRK